MHAEATTQLQERKAAAERRGWRFVVEREAMTRDLGGGLSQSRPAYFEAESYVPCSWGMTTHHEAATSLGQLLDRLDEFDDRKGRL